MNDDKTKPGESSRPSHEAAKVVIPFDIDMSEIESKISDLERRMTSITSQKQPQQAQQPQQEQQQPRYDMPDWRGQPMSYSSQRAGDDLRDNEKNDAIMLATMVRMADLLRQINDTVLLMYSQMMTGRNNA